MLHTKFQDIISLSVQEFKFFKVFTIYGHGGLLGHDCDRRQDQSNKLIPPSHRIHMKFDID